MTIETDVLVCGGGCAGLSAALEASREAASLTRVTAMALGQAAGTATAMSVERGMSPHELNGREVRKTLHQQHAGPILPD